MNKEKILTWEIIGAVIISLLGSFLHFFFALLGEWPPVALIAAVNESVWEHLKLAFWPALIFALIEWPFFRGKTKNFWAAKSIGIFTMPQHSLVGHIFVPICRFHRTDDKLQTFASLYVRLWDQNPDCDTSGIDDRLFFAFDLFPSAFSSLPRLCNRSIWHLKMMSRKTMTMVESQPF